MSFSSINDDQCTSEARMSASDKNPAIIWRKHNKVFLDPAAKHIPAPHGTLVVDLLDQRNSPPACCSTLLISKVLQFLPQPRAFLRKVITPSKYCNFEHNTIFLCFSHNIFLTTIVYSNQTENVKGNIPNLFSSVTLFVAI